MIFVSLGTHEQPFARAIDLVRPLSATDQIVVQHGHTPTRPGEPGFRWIDFLPYEEVVSLMKEADAVVCHAGVGTIVTAVHADIVPVVIPRLHRFHEHVDDHQLQIVTELGSRGLLQPVLEPEDVVPAVEAARGKRSTALNIRSELRRVVAEATYVNSGNNHHH